MRRQMSTIVELSPEQARALEDNESMDRDSTRISLTPLAHGNNELIDLFDTFSEGFFII